MCSVVQGPGELGVFVCVHMCLPMAPCTALFMELGACMPTCALVYPCAREQVCCSIQSPEALCIHVNVCTVLCKAAGSCWGLCVHTSTCMLCKT